MSETNSLASKATQILDSFLDLASSKNPINLDPLQMAYDLSSQTAKKVGEWLSPFAHAITKTRNTILGLFGGSGGGGSHGGGGHH